MTDCGCIDEMNKLLDKYNAGISINLLGPPRALIETFTHKKIRGKKTPYVQATYCPFCGLKYESKEQVL